MPVVADPVRDADYRRYAGCACITPNRVEAGLAAGMRIATPEDGLEAARRLLDFGVEAAMVTLDRDGIAWADAADEHGCSPPGRGRCATSPAPATWCWPPWANAGRRGRLPRGHRSGQRGRRPGGRAAGRRAAHAAEMLAELAQQRHRRRDRSKILSMEQLQAQLRGCAWPASGS